MSKERINLSMNDDELQAFLNKYKRRKHIAIAVIVIGALIALFGFVTMFLVLALPGIIAILVGIVLVLKASNKMKSGASQNIVRGVLESVFDDVYYDPFGRISDELIKCTDLGLPHFEEIRGSDYVRGKYKGLNIEMSDVKLIEVTRTHTNNGYQETRTTVFEGPWLICDFGKELSADLLLVERSGLGKKLSRGGIKTESEEFNKNFRITSDNEHDAFYILTPHMMEYILEMDKKGGGKTHMRFNRYGRVHVAINTGKDSFELKGSNVDVAQLRARFESELRYLTDLIDELRLEDSIYKK